MLDLPNLDIIIYTEQFNVDCTHRFIDMDDYWGECNISGELRPIEDDAVTITKYY